MPIDFPAILDLTAQAEVHWTARDTSLYALGVGLGRDPIDSGDLSYLIGGSPITLPTMAASLAVGKGIGARQMGISFRQVVHLGQEVTLAAPLPAEGRSNASTRVVDAFDRGPGRGAIIVSETLFTDAESDTEIARSRSTIMARADGGFGGPPPPPRDWSPPRETPDTIIRFETRPDQALLFRLSGDTNPLHADPAVAAAAGFERPILHGLCTFGMAARAINSINGGATPPHIRQIKADFSSPVYPGETLEFELWQDGDRIDFRVRAAERNVTVLDRGQCLIAPPAP